MYDAVWVLVGGDERGVYVGTTLPMTCRRRRRLLGVGPRAPAASSEDTAEDAMTLTAMIRVRRGRGRIGRGGGRGTSRTNINGWYANAIWLGDAFRYDECSLNGCGRPRDSRFLGVTKEQRTATGGIRLRASFFVSSGTREANFRSWPYG